MSEKEERIDKYGRTVRLTKVKDQFVDLKVKRSIFNNISTPTLTYRAALWCYVAKKKKRTCVAEIKVLKKMMGKTRRTERGTNG